MFSSAPAERPGQSCAVCPVPLRRAAAVLSLLCGGTDCATRPDTNRSAAAAEHIYIDWEQWPQALQYSSLSPPPPSPPPPPPPFTSSSSLLWIVNSGLHLRGDKFSSRKKTTKTKEKTMSPSRVCLLASGYVIRLHKDESGENWGTKIFKLQHFKQLSKPHNHHC